ncbi:manganese-dependent inorganic pyrophosphatase [Desulfovibrio ferrophilus]|uniref:inorganic diphosphatase n=1 Tax=Desulfovibrio ferrophilus TaxID=241368 RepID=A0A2Z6AWI6_9BACT|nr:manganese-dependent inorganic pyrophosphatase [Desulfovibrio ferrophilus]BBD07580.1 manganese-dependent inorganic pyrophosphatase [Desulfovibrio ferrophilus]
MLVFGHMNPDTDTIVSAIAYADLASKLGKDAKAVAQGAVTPESAYVLEKFGLATPEVVTSVAGQQVAVVDTTELSQLPSDIGEAEVVAVVDHHKLGDLATSQPLEMWVWPVGCTGTVLKNMYDFYNVEIPKGIAGAMMCAILSDTVMFKSVTCTDADKKAVEALAKIAGVADPMEIGLEMFKVKSAVDGTPIRELVFRDYKDFDMDGNGVGIGQLEVVDGAMLLPLVDDLYADIAKVKEEKGHHTVILMLTDIMKEGSEILYVTDDKAVFKKAFGIDAADKSFWMQGCMSRKKQIVPDFQGKAFK